MPSQQAQNLRNALKLFIVDTFDQEDWVRAALETGTIESIQRDDRLFKALSWGDSDYPVHAVARADDILNAIRADASLKATTSGDRFRLELETIGDVFPKFYGWAHKKKPEVAALFEEELTSESEVEDLFEPIESAISSSATIESPVGSVTTPDNQADRLPDPLEIEIQPRKVEIFLVHGHDHVRRDEIAAFILKATGIRPIVLSDQPNEGRTIIEKFELHANTASIAVVLLTPDDHGAANGKPPAGRARQNVIFEMGYFTGRLSRKQVIPLDAGVEQPSDVDGLLYIPLNESWKPQLRIELQAAGAQIIG